MNHRKNLLVYFSLCVPFLFVSMASAEDKSSRQKTETSNRTRYVDIQNQKAFDPDISPSEIKALANSVEFEVYVMNEESSSQSVFVSGAGVCNGFDADFGVDFTNSTNNYINLGDDSQYYGGITGASLYRKGEPTNVQYVPVYAIDNSQLEKEIREQQGKQTKQIVKHQINTNKQLLDKTICKPAAKKGRK